MDEFKKQVHTEVRKVLCKKVKTDEETKETLTNKYFTHKDIVDTVDEIITKKGDLEDIELKVGIKRKSGRTRVNQLKKNIENLEKKLETLHAPIVKQLAEIAKCRRAEKYEALQKFLKDKPPNTRGIGGIIRYTTLFKVENDPEMIKILEEERKNERRKLEEERRKLEEERRKLETKRILYGLKTETPKISSDDDILSDLFSQAAGKWLLELEQSKSKNSYKLPVDAYLLLRPRPGKRGAFEDKRFRDPRLLQMYSGENIQYLKF
jgi:hypothetical protein